MAKTSLKKASSLSRAKQKQAQESDEVGFLTHPLTRLVAVTLTLTGILRLVFFYFAPRIWALQEEISLQDITPWTRWAMADRDGAEPQVLLLLTLALAVLTVAGMQLLQRAPQWLSSLAVACCLPGALIFALTVPPAAPMPEVDASWLHISEAVAGVLAIALIARRATQNRLLQLFLGALLLPVCFIAVYLPSHGDLATVLAPALKLRLGFSPAQIYFQYDFLTALVAVAWHNVGGAASEFTRTTQFSFFLMLGAVFYLSRKIFRQKWLAGLLFAAVCLVRVYGIVPDANVIPQVTPLRIDLWLLLLLPALLFGLRHWSVGLGVGLLYFFSRSFGVLYLGSYALALSADFLTLRADATDRIPLWRALSGYLRPLFAGLLLIAAGLLASRLVFGSLVSDAVLTYRRLGVGMMRIGQDSFYWWIAAALAATGWLAFSLRSLAGQQRTGASFFLLALGIGNSIYFFGRSHEHNLLNISAPLLFCFFLGIDLAIAAWHNGPQWVRWSVNAAPWLTLVFLGYFYSGRLVSKVHTQYLSATAHQALPGFNDLSPVACDEISMVSKDSRVFVYAYDDYWIYEQCGYVPEGYTQPLYLQPSRVNLIRQLDQLLNSGYRIIVPKFRMQAFDFADVAPNLPGLNRTDTPHYEIYSRNH